MVAVVLMAGCATSGRKSTTQTEAAIDNLEGRMDLAKDQIDSVVLGLQALQGKEGQDLEKAYSVFKKEVAQVENTAADLKKRADTLKKQGEAHFAAWEKGMETLNDEELREMSEARKAQLKEKYGALASSLKEAGREGQDFMGDLDNIVKYLDLDLTPASVGMLGDRVTKTEADAGDLKTAIDNVTEELKKLAGDLGSAQATGATASE